MKVLQRVWAASGGQCGKYLAVSMRTQLDGLERHGELVAGVGRYSMAVRAELLAMSAAYAVQPVERAAAPVVRVPYGGEEERNVSTPIRVTAGNR